MNLSVANVLAFAVNLALVYSGERELFGKDNAEVSTSHPTLITPAKWTFSIWGVIFTTELLFVIWQAATPAGKSDTIRRGIGPWFVVACILQALWSIAFSKEYLALSAGLLVGIAVALGLAVIGLAPYKSSFFELLQTAEGWLVHFPIGLHAGWSFAAALVNISVALESRSGSTRFAALVLTVVVACLAAVFAAANLFDLAFLCAVAWALAGIADESRFRDGVLPVDVAHGVKEALTCAWVGLLAIGAITTLRSMFK